MGGGIIIINQNQAVSVAVNDRAVFDVLPNECQERVKAINSVGVAEWSEHNYAYMVSMLTVARHHR